jgi:mono/diheme cytochrome c family protein
MIRINNAFWRILGGLVLICIPAFFTSCEYEKKEALNPDDLPEVVRYSEHIQPVFDANCIKCHNGSTSPDLRSENSYFDLSSGNFIDTDNPENSYLYEKINGSGSMAQYADDYDRALILKWITQGAEDN